MCGRFTLTRIDSKSLAAGLGAELREEDAALYKARYNIAPTDVHFIVRAKKQEEQEAHGAQAAKRELLPARWGLVNHWAKDAKRGAQQINARTDGVAKRPAYRQAFVSRRCGVPADGYFEWIGPPKVKHPIWFHLPDSGVFLMAGLYESWTPPGSEQRVRTFTILTTAARGRAANFHDRMPLILAPSKVDTWLTQPVQGAPEEFIASVEEPDAEMMLATEVSRRVNSVKNDDPECLASPGPMDGVPKGRTGSLF